MHSWIWDMSLFILLSWLNTGFRREFSLFERCWIAMVKLHYFRNQRYSKLKSQCEKDGRLFTDPEFPADDKSMFFSRSPEEPVEWKRPKVRWTFNLPTAVQLFIVSPFPGKKLLHSWFDYVNVQSCCHFMSAILSTLKDPDRTSRIAWQPINGINIIWCC